MFFVKPRFTERDIQQIVIRAGVADCVSKGSARSPGADPGFLEGGFKSAKRGFVFNILPDFSYIFP